MSTTEQLLRETFHDRAGEISFPADLGGRVLLAHRRQRRQRLSLASTAAALALLVVGVVVPLHAAHTPDGTPPAAPGAYPYPPRGSLADDREFMAEALAVPWGSEVGPPLETRQVVFAGDVPGARWARVVGLLDGDLVGAWLAGPPGADGHELTLLAATGELSPDGVDSFGDFQDPEGPLVVLARPGDTIEYSPRPQIGADGGVSRRYVAAPVTDGAAILGVADGGPWVAVRVRRDDAVVQASEPNGPVPSVDYWTDSQIAAAATGSVGTPDPDVARGTLAWLTERTGLGPADVEPSITWANGGESFAGLLLTAILPSGAVAAVGSCGSPSSLALGLLQLYPAGTDPADLLLVQSCVVVTPGLEPPLGDFLVLVGPEGTHSFAFTDSGQETLATGSDRVVYASDPEGHLQTLQNFRAVDPDGTVLATATVGTVEDFGP